MDGSSNSCRIPRQPPARIELVQCPVLPDVLSGAIVLSVDVLQTFALIQGFHIGDFNPFKPNLKLNPFPVSTIGKLGGTFNGIDFALVSLPLKIPLSLNSTLLLPLPVPPPPYFFPSSPKSRYIVISSPLLLLNAVIVLIARCFFIVCWRRRRRTNMNVESMTKDRTPRTMAAIMAGDMRFAGIFCAVIVFWLASAW